MWPFERKSTLERVIDTVTDSLDVPDGVKSNLPSGGSGKVKAGLLTAGGLAGLTALSAAVSSLRRRSEGSDSGS